MNTVVTYNIAKRLKEIGFEENCAKFYTSNGKLDTYRTRTININKITDNYAAPTIADVIDWLYKKHDIWIIVQPSFGSTTFMYSVVKYNEVDFIEYDEVEGWMYPSEAYTKAIEYILKELL